MSDQINKNKLFIASCLALTVTAMTFAIRAGILGQLSQDFALSDKIRDELAEVGIQLKDGKDGTTFSVN